MQLESQTPRRLKGVRIFLFLGCTLASLGMFRHLHADHAADVISESADHNLLFDMISASAFAASINNNRSTTGVEHTEATGVDTPTFVMVCGHGETDATKEMVPLINSLILLSSSVFRLVFVTDEDGAHFIDNLLSTLSEKATNLKFVDVRIVTEFDEIEAYAYKMKFNLQSHHAGIWGFVKVILPWLLVEYPRFAVIDTDMVFVQDPLILWQHFHDIKNIDESAQEWLYALDLNNFKSPATICSCVVLMKASLILSSNIFPDGFKHALEEIPDWYTGETNDYLVPYGDQGLYFSLSKINHSIAASLPAKWNVDRCHKYLNGALENVDFDVGEFGLLHRNCYDDTKESHRHDAAAPFFDFYRSYQLSMLPTTDIKGKSFDKKTGNATLIPLKQGKSKTAERMDTRASQL